MTHPQPGTCLCGSVTFSAEPEKAAHACHCGLCRRFSGGVFMVADCGTSVAVEKGSDALVWYDSSDWGERGFCGRCGSSLFWRSKADGRTYTSVQAFENPDEFVLSTEIFIDSKPASYSFANHTHRMTEAEFLASLAEKQG